MYPQCQCAAEAGRCPSPPQRQRGFRRGVVVGAVTVLVAAASGIATASVTSVPDNAGLLHGCYNRVTGSLRLIDPARRQACATSEHAVTWNQAGPTGPRGGIGADGPPGVVSAIHDENNAKVIGTSFTVVVQTNQVPVGSYLLVADIPVRLDSADTVGCIFTTHDNAITSGGGEFSWTGNTHFASTIPLDGYVTTTVPNDQIQVSCRSQTGGFNANAGGNTGVIALTAIPVNSVGL